MAEDEILTVFVPLPEREWDYLEKNCSLADAPEELSGEARRVANRSRWLDCIDEYVEIRLNDMEVRQDDLRRAWRTTEAAQQFGAEFTFIDTPARRGKNMLEVVTQFPLRENDPTPRTTNVPFYVK